MIVEGYLSGKKSESKNTFTLEKDAFSAIEIDLSSLESLSKFTNAYSELYIVYLLDRL